MKLEAEVYNNNFPLKKWAIKSDNDCCFYLNESSSNIYYTLYEREMIDPPEIIKEKFNAYSGNPFLFKNKEDAERFLEYLEPFIIIYELTK